MSNDKLGRLHVDEAAVNELSELLDAIHGPERATQGNGTYREPEPPAWELTSEGSEATFPGYHLHVTTDGDVWLNTKIAHFDGLCIGAGPLPIDDAVATLKLALAKLERYPR